MYILLGGSRKDSYKYTYHQLQDAFIATTILLLSGNRIAQITTNVKTMGCYATCILRIKAVYNLRI